MFCGSYKGDEKAFVTLWPHHGDSSDHNVTLVVPVNTEWPPLVWSNQEMRVADPYNKYRASQEL